MHFLKKDFFIYILISLILFIFLEIIANVIYYIKKDRFFLSYHLENHSGFQNFTIHGLYKFKPNVLAHMPGYPDNLFTNKYGFISNDNFEHNLNNTQNYNIFLLGGSTVEGRGASSNSMTISSNLERCLLKKNKNIQVINSGFSGDFSYQEFLRFAGNIIPNYKVDHVITLNGRNDAHFSFSQGTSWKKNHQPAFEIFMNQINSLRKDCITCAIDNKLRRYSLIYYSLNFYLSKINLLKDKEKKHAFSRSYSKENFNSDVIESNIFEASKMYINNIKLIHSYASDNQIKYNGYIQPILDVSKKRNISKKEKIFLEKYSSEYGEVYFDFIFKFYKNITNNNPLFLADISDLFYNISEDLYYDSVHYGDLANKIIADKICQDIQSNL
jgi:hypothetical protein